MKRLFFCILLFLLFFVYVFSVDNSLVTVKIKSLGLIIGTPENLDLGTVIAGNTIDFHFDNYFWIEDLRGTVTGHYTTIQCDGLYGPNGYVITGIQLSGIVIDLVAGVENNTSIYSNLNTWTDVTKPALYLYRNPNTINTGGVNRYGNKPSIRISVPLDAPAGSYKGKITYTLYDMAFTY